MAKFDIGESVIVNGGNYAGVVVGIDSISYPLPLYEIKINETGELLPYYELAIKKLVTPDDALRYGEILTDENLYCEFQAEDGFEDWHYVRIRTIRYESHIFYHKMVNGEVVEFKELTV